MRPEVEIIATPKTLRRYRQLLRDEWDDGLAASASLLLRAVLEDSGLRLWFHWEKKPERTPARLYPIPANASESVREFLEASNARLVEARDQGGDDDRDPLARAAFVAWTLLLAQHYWSIGGASGFFRDGQALLFYGCARGLLDRLRDTGHAAEHALLRDAMNWHASNAWPDDGPQTLQFRAVLAEHAGLVEESGRNLLNAFRLTPPTEHDYMTRAQSYWAHLVAEGRGEEAATFALDLYRAAPDECLVEARRLIAASFREDPPRRVHRSGDRRR